MCAGNTSAQNIPDNERCKVKFEHFDEFHTVALRILLVDDKVGSASYNCKGIEDGGKEFLDLCEIKEQGLKVFRCKEENDCHDKGCKLCTIKRLMDNGLWNGKDGKDGKKDVFPNIGEKTKYYYWKESGIECYYCPTVLKDFLNIDNIDSSAFEVECDFWPIQDGEGIKKSRKSIDNVQIIGVKDVRTALLLLSRYKFDMLFFDYLLDFKDENSKERDYSIQFFEFLSNKEFEKKAKTACVEEREKYKLLAKLRRSVLDNRGPLDKLWIMPITGFNSPFIQTLQNKNVPLISTRWHIENGTDPITTPWQFLVKLNQFIELQLKGCVYDIDKLLKFLTISGVNVNQRLPFNKNKKNKVMTHFHDFQDLMGAEYSNFMMRFGARPIIRRDALTGEDGQDCSDKSVFSTYVWRKFYTDMGDDDTARREKKTLFSLHNLMQIFYQEAATMPEDRNGVLRLREAFRRMRYYVDINDLKEMLTDEERKNELEESLDYFANRIDSLLVEKRR